MSYRRYALTLLVENLVDGISTIYVATSMDRITRRKRIFKEETDNAMLSIVAVGFFYIDARMFL